MSMVEAARQKSSLLKTIILVVAAIFGSCLLVWNSLSFVLANSRPDVALQLRPDMPEALASKAKATFVSSLTNLSTTGLGDAPRILAAKALVASPLAPDALGVWMQHDLMTQDGRKTRALVPISDKLGYRDALATLSIAYVRAQDQDIDGVIARLDTIMRTSPDARALLTPMLTQQTEDPLFVQSLVRVLATNPPWRTRFLETLGGNRAASAGAWATLVGLRSAKNSPSEEELGPWFQVNGRTTPPDVLRARWMEFFGDRGQNRSALIIDPGFVGKSGPPPIAWYRANSSQMTADFREVPGYGAGTSLYVTHSGTEDSLVVEQQTYFAAGTWKLGLRINSDLAIEGQAMRLTLTCMQSGQTLIKSDFPVTADITARAAIGQVPSGGCSAQRLQIWSLRNAAQTTVSLIVDDVSATSARQAERASR